MAPKNGTGWWIAGLLGAILVTGLGSWVTLGADKITEEKATEICEGKISPVKEDVKEIKEAVKVIRTDQIEVMGDIKVLLERTERP